MALWRRKQATAQAPEIDVGALTFAELAGILRSRLLEYRKALLDRDVAMAQGNYTEVMKVWPRIEAGAALFRAALEVLAQKTFPADEVAEYRSALRAGMADGAYAVELTRIIDIEFGPPPVLACLAFLGLDSSDAAELVTKVRHVGRQSVIEDVSLADAVTLKETLEGLELSANVSERDRVARVDQPTRHISAEVRREVWRRDGGACIDCGSRERLEFDHIIPVSQGGSNTARNIELRCESCNRKKGATI